MTDDLADLPPPLQGCLYCHSQGTTTLSLGRSLLGLGSDFPILKCSHCNSVAWLDYDPARADHWRIQYRRVNRAPRYYYVELYLGNTGWLSANEALAASTNGYVQRMRVAQARSGDLTWLHPAPLSPAPPLMDAHECVYLMLRAVTFRETPPPGILVRPDQSTMLDSGKFYITDHRLHLLGQRRDWSHSLEDVEKAEYNDKVWTIFLNTGEQYQGANIPEQFDAQLITTVIEALLQN